MSGNQILLKSFLKKILAVILCLAAMAAGQIQTGDYSAFDAKFPGVRKDVKNALRYSVNYSPYTGTYTPTGGPVPPESLIRAHLERIAKNFDFIRVFTADERLFSMYDIAAELGLRVIGTAWIDKGMSEAQVKRQLDNLITLSNAGKVTIASVGSEALVRNDLTPAKLLEHVNYVKARITAPVPVTYMDVTAMFNDRNNADRNALNDACDLILFSHYPVFSNNYTNPSIINDNGGVINYAIAELKNAYRDVKNAQGADKLCILAETGWPTAGESWIGSAQPTMANARGYWNVVQAWAKDNNVNVFWFNSYDEAWKPIEGVLSANHWGLFYGDGRVKESFEDLFASDPTSVTSSNDRSIAARCGHYADAAGSARVAVQGNRLNVSAAAGTKLQIRVFDVKGRAVTRFNAVGNGNFSLSQLPPGRYLAEIKERGGRADRLAFGHL